MKKISIFGSGYVGLVSAVCFAELGHEVLNVDINAEKIALLQQGKTPIYEPGLTELLEKNLAEKRLHFSTDISTAVAFSSILFIAVNTPTHPNGEADLTAVKQLAEHIQQHLNEDKIVVNKSTCPIGTAKWLQQTLGKKAAVIVNPEFLREGCAIEDFLQPDRVVIGGEHISAMLEIKSLYTSLKLADHHFVMMKWQEAEMTKYAANAMLATKISFMNEMSQIAERLEVDIEAVKKGIELDHRIGPYFINPGCGFGGSCFPKDLRALIHTAEKNQYQPYLLQAVQTINEHQKQFLFNKLIQHFNYELQNKTFALWGLAFKPETDDMREATSCVMIELLLKAGAKIQAYDPAARSTAKKIFGHESELILCDTAIQALHQADALIVMTEWQEFKDANLHIIKQHLRDPILFDGRNIYDLQQMAHLEFQYYGIGRGVNRVTS